MDGQVDGGVGITVVSSLETHWSLKAVQLAVYVCMSVLFKYVCSNQFSDATVLEWTSE